MICHEIEKQNCHNIGWHNVRLSFINFLYIVLMFQIFVWTMFLLMTYYLLLCSLKIVACNDKIIHSFMKALVGSLSFVQLRKIWWKVNSYNYFPWNAGMTRKRLHELKKSKSISHRRNVLVRFIESLKSDKYCVINLSVL